MQPEGIKKRIFGKDYGKLMKMNMKTQFMKNLKEII